MLNKKLNNSIGNILLLAILLPLFSGNSFSTVKKEDGNSVVYIIEEQTSPENILPDIFKTLEKVKFCFFESYSIYAGLYYLCNENYINREILPDNNFLLNPFILDIPPPVLS